MGGAVDWDVARTIAAKVAGREPYQAGRYRDGLEEDFARYTAMPETGCVCQSSSTLPRIRGTTIGAWSAQYS
ncbi:MAG: hypothetical protein EBZ17_06005 [Actinobacteria bacterium]|nr:hypothetical protein [Actinomycetota bacterium]